MALLLGAGHQSVVELPARFDGALELLVADQLLVRGHRIGDHIGLVYAIGMDGNGQILEQLPRGRIVQAGPFLSF